MAPSATTTLTIADDATMKLQAEKEEQKKAIERLSTAGGVVLQGYPAFTSVDSERRFILEHMAGAFRIFARKGYSEGVAGHISVRDPEHQDLFWTNPFGKHFGQIKVSDLILLNHDGKAVGGATYLPSNAAGFQIHSHLHKRHPHVNAACHTHSKYGKAYSSFAEPLEMISQDACIFYKSHGVYPDFNGIVLDESEGERLADCLGPNGKGLILRNHGLLTVGRTVDEAAYLYTLMERCCEVQLMVDQAVNASGKKKVFVDDQAAKYTHEAVGDPEALFCDFQPDYEMELELSGGTFLK
ncbi:putative class ii aldolase adducin domain containing protein [Phaeomoniella chlamydospora]|uniref:Putative class ii aldolase adducin domain containing protein n=1 Tax=Phaeomoniella chlamydospora TaxID=158046 RepID=A0A0G2EY83_PHACM|nr:putative class ii aldolase adducin domain containing protein [Phaeomoniella chlamydospora]